MSLSKEGNYFHNLIKHIFCGTADDVTIFQAISIKCSMGLAHALTLLFSCLFFMWWTAQWAMFL